jgi:DNA replication and repair protein RecF
MLADLRLHNFRCFESLGIEFSPRFNFFVARNGQGKTSILEAACVLLRLQSQRSATLAPLIRFGEKSFAVSGHVRHHLLDFRYSLFRRKAAFDRLEQRSLDEYLRLARVVSFANADIELARGGSEARRRYLDFLGAQISPTYRPTLRAYERALRSRNALLRSPVPVPRELAAYDEPLLEHGAKLSTMRAGLVERLAPLAALAHTQISGIGESLALEFSPGSGQDFARALANSRAEESRLRQTIVGPHRDDIRILVGAKPANQYASEGQQRTVALALKIAQAQVFMMVEDEPPLLLIDDIFGELDPVRRNMLLAHLPVNSQKLVTVTTMQWCDKTMDGMVFELENGELFQQ